VSTARPKHSGSWRWFLRDFLYDPELLGREEVDEEALSAAC
jgi:hypothetical protein